MSSHTIPPLVASGATNVATGTIAPLHEVIENITLLAPEQMGHIQPTTDPLSFLRVRTLDTVNEAILQSAIQVYQAAFSRAPYYESFSVEDVRGVFGDILGNDGDLVLGVKQEKTISLTGGYPTEDGTYMIDELAVHPEEQGNGYGKKTLEALFDVIKERNPPRQELRTGLRNNDKALHLYTSKGFQRQPGVEAVANARLGGTIGLDERVYLSKPALPLEERMKKLKQMAVAYPSGNTTAVVFDKLLEHDRKWFNNSIMNAWKGKMPQARKVEQCCFVTMAQDPAVTARIEMFGGEFRGDAPRSAVWAITQGKKCEGLIEVSSVSRPLKFIVENGEVELEMPLPIGGRLIESVEEGLLVFFEGITHLVVTETHPLLDPKQLLETLIKEDKYHCTSYPAFCVTTYDKETKKADFCVSVKALDYIDYKTACGSGTSAIGIALVSEGKESSKFNVIQPSGETLRTSTNYDSDRGVVTESFITGPVSNLFKGIFQLN